MCVCVTFPLSIHQQTLRLFNALAIVTRACTRYLTLLCLRPVSVPVIQSPTLPPDKPSQAQSDMSLCPPAFKWRLTSIKWNSSSSAWESRPSGSDLDFHTYLPSATDTHTPGYGYLSLGTTSSISTTWELVRNENPLPTPAKLNQKLRELDSGSLSKQALQMILMHSEFRATAPPKL